MSEDTTTNTLIRRAVHQITDTIVKLTSVQNKSMQMNLKSLYFLKRRAWIRNPQCRLNRIVVKNHLLHKLTYLVLKMHLLRRHSNKLIYINLKSKLTIKDIKIISLKLKSLIKSKTTKVGENLIRRNPLKSEIKSLIDI